MGGRVYHPGIGRFLSADPFIQSPLSSQSYNRYSYLWNSPLNGTDPSGYFSYNANIPQHLSGVETWQYIASDQFNLPTPTNVNWSLSQARAHYRAEKDRANLLIQAELPHINRNFSREELYAIGTGQRDIGLSAQAQKRINGVINQAYQWRELAREIKKANSGWRRYVGTAITAVLIIYQVPPEIAAAIGGSIGAAANGGNITDIAKAGFQGYISGKAYASTGNAVNASAGGTASQIAIQQGKAMLAHGAIGGIMADWNGGSFSDGFINGLISKGASFWAEGMGFGATSAANYFTTIAAAGISAEITGADVGDNIAMASIGWFANQFASKRGAQKPQGDFVEVTDPITGERIQVHRDYVGSVATYAPPSSVSASDVAQSADNVSTGFGLVAAYGFATGQGYIAGPASIIALGATGVKWLMAPPTPGQTFGFYADSLLGNYVQNPGLQLCVDMLNPFQTTIEFINE